ncbi:MAG TPA: sigma 54-interacting transcriptional regulator [Planctomycetota bacterium]|nr:sigma 54-interacting transcriptional regulator [Planctomycetota bacterium]
MDGAALHAISLAAGQERSVDSVLRQIVTGLAGQPSVALARVWLAVGDGSLQLAASAGTPRASPGESWMRTDGDFRRIPVGKFKVGEVAGSGRPVLVGDALEKSEWAARPDWARREGIRSFAGQPLVFRGEVLGVLGVFGREAMSEADFLGTRLLADHAAAAIANGRAFDEIQRLRERLEAENSYLLEDAAPSLECVGKSPALLEALAKADQVAATSATVLLLGETGVGKEIFAQRIHRGSPRRDRPLIRVNGASIPRELFESEFFGHVKGSFTGALKDRAGRFQAADGGTLFLDEVGEIPLELQPKLLRAVQEGEFQRVGEDRPRRSDVRIIAATNRDLAREARDGRFREDLYYRLSVFPIRVPPLRERREDVGPLAAHFAARASKRFGIPAGTLEPSEIARLERYDWPGNVRELENVVERAVIVARGRPLRFELGDAPTRPPSGQILTDEQVRRLERENLEAALAKCGGKISGAGGVAELLGLSPSTVASRLKAMGIKA